MFKRNIPNYLTLINLGAGVGAIFLIYTGELNWVFLCVGISLVADLLDGLIARLLKVSGPMGVQLDSLADLVSFGVMPAFFLFALIEPLLDSSSVIFAHAFAAIFYVMCACWRLAKFNITESKGNDFNGLPSPAAGLFILSYSLLILSGIPTDLDLKILTIPLLLIIGFLMVSNIGFISLKFNPKVHKANFYRYLLIGLTPLPLFIIGISGVFISMVFYLFLSIVANFFPISDKD
ncbi:MAG: hypothetical protein EA362_06100 [Saprospirales bacterium]|nr:MAG: hypothetical protein EA362_06100 [Saprospirales bacterium]